MAVLAGEPPRIATFGYSDDDAFAVGLTCGGTVHLYLEELEWGAGSAVDLDVPQAAVAAHRPVALITVVDGPRTGSKLLVVAREEIAGQLPDTALHRRVARDAPAALATATTAVRHYRAQGPHNKPHQLTFYEPFR